jgi:hypothetical protein
VLGELRGDRLRTLARGADDVGVVRAFVGEEQHALVEQGPRGFAPGDEVPDQECISNANPARRGWVGPIGRLVSAWPRGRTTVAIRSIAEPTSPLTGSLYSHWTERRSLLGSDGIASHLVRFSHLTAEPLGAPTGSGLQEPTGSALDRRNDFFSPDRAAWLSPECAFHGIAEESVRRLAP